MSRQPLEAERDLLPTASNKTWISVVQLQVTDFCQQLHEPSGEPNLQVGI